MENIKINNWRELLDILFDGAWDEEIKRYRSSYCYRGVPDMTKSLTTSLAFLKGELKEKENHLLRNFRKYAGKKAAGFDSIWHWLSISKHYNLPSRILDWSFSPLIALHFATDNLSLRDKDGALFFINYKDVHSRLPDDLRGILEAEKADLFTVDMLGDKFSSLPEFDNYSNEKTILFFEPESADERIIHQYALFSIMNDVNGNYFNWFEDKEIDGKLIQIPAGLKMEIRDKLDQLNINERILFPGLEGLAKWLKRVYLSFE